MVRRLASVDLPAKNLVFTPYSGPELAVIAVPHTGTAIFKTCREKGEKLPTGTAMDVGDIAVAVRFLERASKTCDKQQLTFINKRSTPPVLINAS